VEAHGHRIAKMVGGWLAAGVSAEDSAPKAARRIPARLDSKDNADKDSEEKQAQIFVMPMNGGDPIRVTEAKHGVEEFAWSPDGKQIASLPRTNPSTRKPSRSTMMRFKSRTTTF